MLKDVLVRWKDEVKAKEGQQQMTKEEMVARLRELVAGDEKLLANPFFQSVKTL